MQNGTEGQERTGYGRVSGVETFRHLVDEKSLHTTITAHLLRRNNE